MSNKTIFTISQQSTLTYRFKDDNASLDSLGGDKHCGWQLGSLTLGWLLQLQVNGAHNYVKIEDKNQC